MPRVRKPKGTLDPSLQLRLDWKAYFDDFCQAHGPPVEWGGRVLFPDGWSYSITSYQGPEYMPPEDPQALLRLQAEYWRVRYEWTKNYFDYLKDFITEIKKAGQFRDRPLKHRYSMTTQNEYGEKVRVTQTTDVDLNPYLLKLKELAGEVNLCKTERENKINEYAKLSNGRDQTYSATTRGTDKSLDG